MAGLLGWFARQLADDRQHDHVQIRLESDRNLVQIITIHKSKGLEFPVVFCPFLWDSTVGKTQQRDEVLVFSDANDGPTIHFVQKQQADERLDSIKNHSTHLCCANARCSSLLSYRGLLPFESEACKSFREHKQYAQLVDCRE
jgi:ATP-dependent exoDNAse (exonuclease V) beta subunit